MRKMMIAAAAAMVIAVEVSAAWMEVDFSQPTGTIKKINGVCNAPPIANTRNGGVGALVAELEAPYYHLHDDALLNPGYDLVDVSRIFPLFHADVDDPRNYNFEATDDYIRFCVEHGGEIDFRLGEAIEHAQKNYKAVPPKDPVKWAEICAHIVRHYNKGWANGHHWNIKYWSVWEEPDNRRLFAGTDSYVTKYLPLYVTTAKRLKAEFPEIKIGGPNCMGAGDSMKKFLEYVKEHKAPLDVVCWTAYSRNLELSYNDVHRIRRYLDENGFTKTEIAINEWHLGPISWSGEGFGHGMVNNDRVIRDWNEMLNGYNAAVFASAVLSRMQDAPIDQMAYYSMKCDVWGIFTDNLQPTPAFYALKAFATLARGTTRVKTAQLRPEKGWYVLASKDEKTGKGHILVSAFQSEGRLGIILKGGVTPKRVWVIDSLRNLDEIKIWTWKDGKLTIPRDHGFSAMWLVEVER